VYHTVPSALTATSWGRDPDGTSYSSTTDGADVTLARALVVAADVPAAGVLAAADVTACVASSAPDEHASAVTVAMSEGARTRSHDDTRTTIGTEAARSWRRCRVPARLTTDAHGRFILFTTMPGHE
jgi:hypothetical protein